MAAVLELAVQLTDGRWLNATMAGGPPPAWGLPNLVTLPFTASLVGVGVAPRRVRQLSRLDEPMLPAALRHLQDQRLVLAA